MIIRPADPLSHVRPRLRGVLHQYAFFAAVVGASVLMVQAQTRRALVVAAVYGASLVALFGVSALYHRLTWSPRGRRWMGRLDHSMISFLIAGTFTPLAVVLPRRVAIVVLSVVWAGALVSTVLHTVWIDAPKWVSAVLYVALGWTGLAAMPELVANVGWAATALLGLGGAFYSAGAVIYALQRPNPAPAVFGYHEVFHALVVAAALTHYAVVAFFVLPHA